MGYEIKNVANTDDDVSDFHHSLGPHTLYNFDHFYWDDTYKTFYVYSGKKIIAYGFLRQTTHRFKKHLCVLGMVVADTHQGKGVGTMLGKKMIKWARGKYSKIALGVYADNINALRFYEKLGFVIEGILRKEELHNNEYRDIITMALML